MGKIITWLYFTSIAIALFWIGASCVVESYYAKNCRALLQAPMAPMSYYHGLIGHVEITNESCSVPDGDIFLSVTKSKPCVQAIGMVFWDGTEMRTNPKICVEVKP